MMHPRLAPAFPYDDDSPQLAECVSSKVYRILHEAKIIGQRPKYASVHFAPGAIVVISHYAFEAERCNNFVRHTQP